MKTQMNICRIGRPRLSQGVGWFGVIAMVLLCLQGEAGTGTVAGWGDAVIQPTTAPFKAIAAGGAHSLALTRDGRVVAWGHNDGDQCAVPADLSGVRAIAAGWAHSLALKTDGTVAAWGNSYYGQGWAPGDLSGVQAIAAGAIHNLALKSDGTVVAWGNTYYGASTVPEGLSGVEAIAAGAWHSLALKSDGTVVAWGLNDYGQSTVPTGLSGVQAIAAGERHTLALKSDGTVVSWGDNSLGQRTVPTDLSGVLAIAAGEYHSLALKSDGTVVAWGDNSLGQRTVLAGLGGVQAVAAGNKHSLALKSNGTVVAWGSSEYAQCLVPGSLSEVQAISESAYHSLALKSDGTVVAWGNNYYGASTVPAGLSGVRAVAAGSLHNLALKNDGTVVAWGIAYDVVTTVPEGLSGVQAIAAGAGHSLALKSDGTVLAWGDNGVGQCTVPEGLSGVRAIGAGQGCSLALKSDGTVVAWGDNYNGQITVPAGLSGVQAIAVGEYHSLALTSDGTVVAWGSGGYGQTTVPSGLNGVQAIAAGQWHSLALKSDGTVAAWGWDAGGACSVPAGLAGAQAIAAGRFHSLAIVSVTALPQTLTTLEDTPLAITLDGLGNGGSLGYVVQTSPLHGTLSGTAPDLVYTPAPDFHGSDSFTFAVTDGQATSLPAEIGITVIDVLMGLSSISPEYAIAGQDHLVLTVNGSSFEWDTVVYWNGSLRATTYLNAGQVTALILASDLVGGPDVQTVDVTVGEPTASESKSAIVAIFPRTVGGADTSAVGAGETATLSVPPTSTEPGVQMTVQNNGGNPVTGVAATYDTKPVQDNVFRIDNGSYIDVQLTGADSSDTALVYFYYPGSITGAQENGLKLSYYMGTGWVHVLSSGGVQPPKDTVLNRFTVLFDNTSTPKITELTGTIFGMYDPTPQILAVSGPSAPLAVGGSASITVQYATPSVPALCSILFAWDDGTSTPMSSGDGSATATHQYAAPGVYRVTVTVSDDTGRAAMSAFEYVVVYDPTGGFVTGGGWVNSPAGAFNPDLEEFAGVVGKANFGFVAKYQKGANVPTGSTEFQFKAGNLNFKSTSYEWLVVAGARAQFKGWGTINGQGSYAFMLTAIDGQVNGGGGADRFRIKIWDDAGGAKVYDNQHGTDDNAGLAGGGTLLQGGSIVIHKP